MQAQWHLGPLALGNGPLVVGTIQSAQTLITLATPPTTTCDLVEIRLDGMDATAFDWLGHCRKIEAGGLPVLLTLRSAREGGGWTAPDADRLPLLEAALHALSAIDVEADSPCCAPLCQLAARLGKTVVASFHDFDRTPPLETLRAKVATIRQSPQAIPKLATMIRDTRDIATLAALLASERHTPICVIGMGPVGAQTRLSFAQQGSCLTYGYLDNPTAPGQWSASELRAALAAP